MKLRLVILVTTMTACTTGEAAAPWAPLPARTEPVMSEESATPKDINALFDRAILPTCALSGGVCHNAKTYPDLRNLSALVDLVDLPCGADVASNLPDVCEPVGDRLAGVEIMTAEKVDDARIRLSLADDVPPVALDAITRGAWTFDLHTNGVAIERFDARTVEAKLDWATPEAQAFFDLRLPLRPERLWPADPNRNGVAGATRGFREIVPGHPERSYVVARLWDSELSPELMPRQCRTWTDAATRALGCWVQGLVRDANGRVQNFFDPIDYARCTFEVPTAGRCGP